MFRVSEQLNKDSGLQPEHEGEMMTTTIRALTARAMHAPIARPLQTLTGIDLVVWDARASEYAF